MRLVFLSLFVLTISGLQCRAQSVSGIDRFVNSFERFSTLGLSYFIVWLNIEWRGR